MSRSSFDDRTLAPGIPTDAWEHDGDNGNQLGRNPKLIVDVSKSENLDVSIANLTEISRVLTVSLLDISSLNNKILEQLVLLNNRFEETFDTKLTEADND